MNVVDLGRVRDLSAAWETVRKNITADKVQGFALCVKSTSGEEWTYFGGSYKEDPEAALFVALQMSMEINKCTG